MRFLKRYSYPQSLPSPVFQEISSIEGRCFLRRFGHSRVETRSLNMLDSHIDDLFASLADDPKSSDQSDAVKISRLLLQL